MRRIAHRALHVLEDAAEAEGPPQLELFGVAQQVRLLGVERSPPGRNPTELLIHSHPLHLVLGFPLSIRGLSICHDPPPGRSMA